MTANRFFIRECNLQSSTAFLCGEEHHHLSRVARIKPKDKVWLFDEHGNDYLARVDEIRKDRTQLTIIERRAKDEPKIKITLAQALLKSKKMDIILQKSAELGVSTFIPVIAARSVAKIEAKIENKVERWKKIAREAAKQSGSSLQPSIFPPLSLHDFLEQRDEVKKIFLSENRGEYFRDILFKPWSRRPRIKNPPPSVVVLIGPEGGWTRGEEVDIVNHGFEAVSLGKRILRAETAAICSLSVISQFWNL